jgi:glutathione S-transferase
MPIDLYYQPESPPARTVLMVAKHLKIPVNIKLMNVLEGDQFKPEFLELNPQHTVPTIVDDGMSLWESRAIITYLCNQYAPNSPLYPRDVNERALVDRWLQYDLGSLYKSITDYTGPMFAGSIKLDAEKEKTMCSALELLDSQLSKSKYVVGSKLTIADLSLLNSVDLLTNCMDYDISDFKFVAGWQARLKRELPYYREVAEDGIENLRNFIRLKIDANPASR